MSTPIILVVDHDTAVLEAVERDVRARYAGDYSVVAVTTAAAALAACAGARDRGEAVALLVAAERVADMSGTALLVEARALHPQARRALLTTHANVEAAIIAVNDIGLDRYVAKPWHPPEEHLYPALDELLADWQVQARIPYVRIRDVMDTSVACIAPDDDLRRAAETVASSGVGDLMVVNDEGTFMGVLSEGDILRNALPDFDQILAAGGTLHDGYQLFMRTSGELSDRPILPLVIADPLVVHPDDHVAKAAIVLIERQIRRLPVVDAGRLVGTVSRTHICRAVMAAP